jgi:transcriptional regulator with XRE-family HTH domain
MAELPERSIELTSLKEERNLFWAKRVRSLLGARTNKWLAGKTGIDASTISNFIHGKRHPTEVQRQAIAKAFGLTDSQLVSESDPPGIQSSRILESRITYPDQGEQVLSDSKIEKSFDAYLGRHPDREFTPLERRDIIDTIQFWSQSGRQFDLTDIVLEQLGRTVKIARALSGSD